MRIPVTVTYRREKVKGGERLRLAEAEVADVPMGLLCERAAEAMLRQAADGEIREAISLALTRARSAGAFGRLI